MSGKACSSILRLRGLPYTASNDDLKGFFQGFELVNVCIVQRWGKSFYILQNLGLVGVLPFQWRMN